MLWLLVAFAIVPLLLPWLAARLGPRVFYVASLPPLVAFVFGAAVTPQVLAGHAPTESFTWLPPLGVALSARLDPLSWILASIVSGVGALVLLYCRWYFRDDSPGIGRFAAALLAFAGAMYGLVITDDIVMLVMFWEMTSILSFLLIGHYHQRAGSRRAALQALMVTTFGGLVLLIGVVLLAVEAGTTQLAAILAHAPSGPLADAALVLLLVGALSKSAVFPFHFWLPGAMAAPTPVSAYLHAAAMVKAGIYLLARFAPAFAEAEPWRPVVVGLGLFTLLLGGWQAMRETDLKRLLAYGTVSQLGLLCAALGYGTRDMALAGAALLIAHALFKACLFLVVGLIDRQVSTRDVRELSGLGRQAPLLAAISIAAVASMLGVAPTLGFVAKEGVLTALLHEARSGGVAGLTMLVAVVAGSALTAGYGLRFLWGALARKSGVADTRWPAPKLGFLGSPLVLAAASLLAGFATPWLDPALAAYADPLPAARAGAAPPASAYQLALWHGLEPALFLSLGAILGGVGLFALFGRDRSGAAATLLPFSASDVYAATVRGIERLATYTTGYTQRGSLPAYLGVIFVVFVAVALGVLATGGGFRAAPSAAHTLGQLIVAPIMILAAIAAVRAGRRYAAVVLVSVTGLGMITLFATHGAPDLAVTQILVETVTLVAFTLVLRRLPTPIGRHHASVWPLPRALLAAGVGVVMALIAIVAAGARIHTPISEAFPQLAYERGHGRNVVNVALVDLRGWDTMGELSVLILAATGVASLVFVTHRADTLPRIREPAGSAPEGSPPPWLVGGQRLRPETRSILLEVMVRVLFHAIIVVSLYLLFAGHDLPGGGFAGGLVAGMALVMRYVAGGPYELGAAAPADPGRLLGAGMALAVACAVVPLLFGAAPLTSAWFAWELPVLGHVELVTSTLFDVGVYLVVIGLVLDVLRSLGAEIDRQSTQTGSAG